VGKTVWPGKGVAAGLVLFLLLAGCGYGLRGSTNNLPPDIQGVYIPVFANDTTEAGAEVVFANALIYEFTRSRILKVVPEAAAQAVITGKIKSAYIEAIIYANQTQAVQRKITITLEVSCKRADNQKILWQNLNLSRYEVYNVTSDPNQTDQNKNAAIQKIAQDLSERIHNAILENF
jgi:outer membrane lipopolysaccharide assembly protein LptE/RlpB